MQKFHHILGTLSVQIKASDNNKNKRHFFKWIKVKKEIHYSGGTPQIHEGEIWWCAIGENVGVEINGKNRSFTRPVLILTKLSKLGFMGVPLTSQKHQGSWYAHFKFKKKNEYAVLAQARVISTYRLYQKMGEITPSDLEKIREKFHNLYCTTKK